MIENEIWWNWVTGPRRLLESIYETILRGQSIWMVCPPNLSWSEEMRFFVERKLTAIDHRLVIVDAKSQPTSVSSDIYFLSRCGISSDRIVEYKAHRKKVPEFLAQLMELQDTVFWVRNIPNDRKMEWFDFWKSLAPRTLSLIAEEVRVCPDAKERLVIPKDKAYFLVNDWIWASDTRLLIYMLAKEKQSHELMQKFASILLSNLCGIDADLAIRMFDEIDFSHIGAYEAIKSFLNRHFEEHSNFPEYYEFNRDPVIMFRKGDDSGVISGILKAQLEVFFPIIEESRISFINQNASFLEKKAPKRNALGEPIENLLDLDIGLLVKTINNCTFASNPQFSRQFSIISKLKDIRNKLAHSTICDPKDIMFMMEVNDNPLSGIPKSGSG